MSAPEFVVFSRRGCHLCDVLLEQLLDLVRGRATVTVRNIADDPELERRYGKRIPVVAAAGEDLCQYRLDADAIRRALAS